MPVNSTLVPDVEALAVSELKGDRVPVAANSVCVLVPATAGATMLIEPDVSPNTVTGGVDIPVVELSTIVILFTRKGC
jgi:hypothetical protein